MNLLTSRKEFILGTGAFLGSGAMAAVAERPLVRFGVVTDVHYADSIDICRSTDVTIRNSFIRSQDDSIAPKWCCRAMRLR